MMSDFVALLLLGVAVSLDSYTVGLTYGIRKVSIPIKAILVISSCTFVILLLAMVVGSIIELYISYQAAEKIGGSILIGIGIWVLYQFFTSDSGSNSNSNFDFDSDSNEALQRGHKMVEFEIKRLGLIIKILKKPMEADIDQSGTISSLEAFLLGLALSLDAFGAGIGAALIDLPPILFSFIVTISSAIFVLIGMHTGRLFSNVNWISKVSFLPGVVLILIGVLKM